MNSSKRGSDHAATVVLPSTGRSTPSNTSRHSNGNGNGHVELHEIAVVTSSELVTDGKPTREMISAAAYQIFVNEGRIQGSDRRHWFEAEAQLRSSPLDGDRDVLATAPRGDSLKGFVAPKEILLAK